jgi:hypothetical protein
MYASNVKYEQRHYYYSILVHIFDRGELKLSSLGFIDDYEGKDSLLDGGIKSHSDVNND